MGAETSVSLLSILSDLKTCAGGLTTNCPPWAYRFEYLFPSYWDCLEIVRKSSLVGVGGVTGCGIWDFINTRSILSVASFSCLWVWK